MAPAVEGVVALDREQQPVVAAAVVVGHINYCSRAAARAEKTRPWLWLQVLNRRQKARWAFL